MTSARKIAANRINAQRSSGPRSRLGKGRVSSNALRHGLAALKHFDAVRSRDIELMARAICGDDIDPMLFEQAQVIAESERVLHCVRAERIAVIERLRNVTARPLAIRDDSWNEPKPGCSKWISPRPSSNEWKPNSTPCPPKNAQGCTRNMTEGLMKSTQGRRHPSKSAMRSTPCARPCPISSDWRDTNGRHGHAASVRCKNSWTSRSGNSRPERPRSTPTSRCE